MADGVFEKLVVEFRGTFDKLQGDMNSAAKTVSSFEKKFATIGRGVGVALGTGIGFGIAAGVKKLTTAALGLADLGDQFKDVRDGFLALGGNTQQIDKASQAIKGLASNAELLRIANVGLLKGIPGLVENFPLIAEAATKVAEATGQDAATAIEALTNAIATGKPRALAAFQVYIEKGASVTEIYRQLGIVAKNLGPLNLGVADTTKTVANAWGDLKIRLGEVIDSNPDLIKQLEDLKRLIETTNWDALGTFLANVATLSVKAASTFGGLVDEITTGFSYLGRVASKYVDLVGEGVGIYEAEKQAIRAVAIEEMLKADAKKEGVKAEKESAAATNRTTTEYTKQRDELAKLTENFNKFRISTLKEEITGGIKSSMDSLNENDFKKYSSLLRSITEVEVDEQLAPYIAANLLTPEAAGKWRELLIGNVVDPVAAEWEAKNKEAFQNSVDFWTDIFENAITGASFDLEDALKRVAIGFAAQMAAAITGVSFAGGAQGFGQSLAASIGFGGGGVSGIGGSIAGNVLAGSSLFAANGVASSFAAGVTGASTVPASAAASSALSAGAAAGPAIPIIVGAVGAYMVAKHFGVFDNKPHPETQARHDAMNFLEEKLGQNVVAGPDNRFNQIPGGAGGRGFEDLNKLGDAAKQTFTGVGQAINALLGITENTGDQVGAILASNFEDVDALRGVVRKLGVGFEELEAKLIETGIASNRMWIEIEGDIEGVENAFKPGLEAVGDYNTAIQNLVESGGRGFEAIQSLRDAAIEAQEAGIKTIEEFKQKLLADGKFTAEQINIIFQALNQRGVVSLEDLAGASDRTAGAVVADMTALGFAFVELAKAIAESTEELKKLHEEASKIDTPDTSPTAVNTTSDINAKSLKSAKFLTMGLSGPESMMPIARGGRRHSGRHSGGGGGGNHITVNMDLRGAQAGVGAEVRRAINEMGKHLEGKVLAIVSDEVRRGGL